MFFREAGKKENPVVLLLQGAPSNADAFSGLMARLSETHRVLFPDLPGYGKTEAPKEYSLSDVETELVDDLVRQGVKEVAIVGFSLGAVRALRLALGQKLKVTRLVLVGGFAEVSQAERDGMMEMVKMVRSQPDFSNGQLRAMFAKRMLAPAYLEAHPEAAAQVSKWLDATTPKVLADELEACAKLEDLTELLPMVRIPVMAMVGDADVASSVAQNEKIARQVRKGTVRVFPGAGHALMIEQPEKFIDTVVEGLTGRW